MSSIIVQVGQCGNQIGQEFWKILDKSPSVSQGNGHVYSHWDNKNRSVHIDSEPKVVKHLLEENKNIRDRNVILGRRGRGTNWALGYHGGNDSREDKILEKSLDSIRKEVERCSSFGGIIMMHSMSGGTGSGLGSHLCECLRDEYGMQYLMNAVVAPHVSGESPLQHYNALLCLATLQRNTDSIVLLQNDEVLSRLEKRYEAGSSVSFTQMNMHIAACLAGFLLPTDTLSSKSGTSIGFEPWEMIKSICPMPSTKFLHVNHLTKSKLTWEHLTGQMLQSVPRYSSDKLKYRSQGNLLVARGDTTNSFPFAFKQIESKVKQIYSCVDWNPFPVDYWTASSPLHGIKSSSASITSVANYSNCVECLNHVMDRAWDKFQAKAYLHWYYQHGCCKDDFDEAFDTLQQVVDDYTTAVT